MHRPKLLHLIVWLGIGGAERQLLTWLRQASERYDVTIGVVEGSPTLEREFLAAGARRVVCFGMRGAADATVWWRLFHHCRRERYDIVHTHGFRADVWGGWAARAAGTPVIISTKHNEDQYLRHPVWRWIGRRTAAMNDRVIVISPGVERFMRDVAQLPSTRLTRITYGVEPAITSDGVRHAMRQSWGYDDDTPVIGVVARLVPQKGHRVLLAAAHHVLARQPRARFVLVGDGPLRAALEAEAKRRGVSHAVRFAGWQSDMSGVYASVDLIALPSLWEGLGLALLEAQSAGKPIVASRVGGIPDVVDNGHTGLLVPAGDVAALADALLDMIEHPARRRAMGEAGRRWVAERFDCGVMTRAIDELYQERLRAKSVMVDATRSRVRILELCEATRSGVGVSFADTIEAVRGLEADVEVGCSVLRDGRFGAVVDRLRADGVPVHVLPMTRAIRPMSDWRMYRALCRLMRERRFDVVHTHGSKAGVLGRLAARATRVPVVIHTPHCLATHNRSHGRVARWCFDRLERRLARYTDTLIAVAPSQARDFLARRLAPRGRVVTIENGIDCAPFLAAADAVPSTIADAWPADAVLIGCVGVLEPSKDHAALLRAFARVSVTDMRVRLVLIGDGPLGPALQSLARELGVASRVHWLGFRADVPQLLQRLALFVLPSRWEGMSIALLEAMAAGLPIVATTVHGTIDLIDHGHTGWLVPPGNIEMLVQGIERLTADRAYATVLGRAAQRRVISQYQIELQQHKLQRLLIAALPGRRVSLRRPLFAPNFSVDNPQLTLL